MGDKFNPSNKGTSIQCTCCTALLCISDICSPGLKMSAAFPAGHVLAVHVLHRGWDAGSIIGAALVCPIVAYRLRTGKGYVQPLLKSLGISACAGTALAGAVACMLVL